MSLEDYAEYIICELAWRVRCQTILLVVLSSHLAISHLFLPFSRSQSLEMNINLWRIEWTKWIKENKRSWEREIESEWANVYEWGWWQTFSSRMVRRHPFGATIIHFSVSSPNFNWNSNYFCLLNVQTHFLRQQGTIPNSHKVVIAPSDSRWSFFIGVKNNCHRSIHLSMAIRRETNEYGVEMSHRRSACVEWVIQILILFIVVSSQSSIWIEFLIWIQSILSSDWPAWNAARNPIEFQTYESLINWRLWVIYRNQKFLVSPSSTSTENWSLILP